MQRKDPEVIRRKWLKRTTCKPRAHSKAPGKEKQGPATKRPAKVRRRTRQAP